MGERGSEMKTKIGWAENQLHIRFPICNTRSQNLEAIPSILRENYFQPRILSPAKLLVKCKDWIRLHNTQDSDNASSMHLEGVTQRGAAVKRRKEPKEREKTWHLAVLCVSLGGHDPSCVQVRLRRFRATEPPQERRGSDATGGISMRVEDIRLQ